MNNQNLPFDGNGFPLDRDGNPTPLFLQGTVGSLAEERKQSSDLQKKKVRDYNKERSKVLRKFPELCSTSLFNFLTNPSETLERLASVRSEYPSVDLDLNLNIGTLILQKVSLLRNFLIWYLYQTNIPKWIEFLIFQELDRLLVPEKLVEGNVSLYEQVQDEQTGENVRKTRDTPKVRITYTSQKYKEALIIYKLLTIRGREETLKIVETIYSKDNLKKWYETGLSLVTTFKVISIPRAKFKEKIRRRGYSRSSMDPNSLNAQKGRLEKMISKSQQNQEYEETIERIKLKQAQLFERRLDAFLALEDDSLPVEAKKEVFSSLLGENFPIEGEDFDKIEIPNLEERREEDGE
jgi:hypothetical protein